MSNSPRTKFLTLCIGAALAQMAGSALADSGTGVDTVIGNAVNPTYSPRVSFLGQDVPEAKRTPSGQMYSFPLLVDEEVDGKLAGSVELGYINRDDRQRYSKLNEYGDPQTNGLYLDSFNFSYETAANAFYFQLNGGAVGRDDQFYNLNIGQYNDWKVKAFYNETPHVFSDTWKAFWTDNGSGRPTQNFVGGGTLAALSAAVPATSEIGLIRKKGGARVEGRLSGEWKAFASATQEDRDGSRPWGVQNQNIEAPEPVHYTTRNFLAGLQYTSGAMAANITAKIDTFQNDVKEFFYHRPTVVDTNLGLAGLTKYSSYPDNSAWELKGELSYKLPSFWNSRFNAAAALGQMRQDDRINTPLPADIPGVFVAANNSAGGVGTNASWNGTAGVPTSRATGGMKIDTELVNLVLNMKPTQDLGLKASYRHWATKNKSGTYYAYNPLTGEWGTGIREEGGNVALYRTAAAAGTCQPAPGFTAPTGCASNGVAPQPGSGNGDRGLFSPPRDFKQDNWVLSASYNMKNLGSLEGSFERENFTRTYRERDKTWENKVKVGYVNTLFEDLSLRASYEDDSKRGSFYDQYGITRWGASWFAVYDIPYSRAALQDLINRAVANGGAANGIYPSLATITAWATPTSTNGTMLPGAYGGSGFMKTDQADRDQHIFNARLNYTVSDAWDAGFNVQLKRVTYPSNNLGSQKDNLNSYSIDTSYQPSPGLQLSAWYTRQDGKQTDVHNYGQLAGTGFASLDAYASSICGTQPAAAGAILGWMDCMAGNGRIPSSNVVVDTDTTNDIFGLGYQQDIGSTRFGVDYTFNKSRSTVSNRYGPTALTAAQQATVAQLGSAWPGMTTRQQSLEATLLVPLDRQWTARFMYRYDDFEVKDWHYDYMNYYATSATGTYMPGDMGPANFSTNTLGVFLKYKL